MATPTSPPPPAPMQPPPYGWQPPYPPPPRTNGLATAGFVVSLIGAVFALIPFVGVIAWLICPVGLVLAIVGLTRAAELGGRGQAVAGVVLGGVGLLICVAWVAGMSALTADTNTQPPRSSSSTSTYSAPSYRAPSSGAATQAAPAQPAQDTTSAGTFSDGTYAVGVGNGEIAPGRYRTTGSNPGAVIDYCAVVRENTDGSIIDLDNSSGGPIVVSVQRTDGQVQFQGDCTWTRTG